MYRKIVIVAAMCVAPIVLSSAAGAAKQGERCGGIAPISCDAGLWCQMPTGQCTVADGAGTCAKTPALCDAMFLPVCGCDGKTYSNDCTRVQAQAQLSHDGACAN
jgi:hypothetical protein